jgi:pimeloyl-ACP methyl ester carboxylesterase
MAVCCSTRRASPKSSADPPVAAPLTEPERREQFVTLSGLTLCVARDEEPHGEPMLLIGGLGMQLAAWPAAFVDGLRTAGFDVITYDQRDVGRSTVFEDAGPPDLLRALRKDRSRLAYGLEDLADDALGLLGALEIPDAHLVGISMGAMVAQLVVLRAPKRVRSLCSLMGTTGKRGVGQSSNAALVVMMQRSEPGEDGAVAQRLAQRRVTAGSSESIDEAEEEANSRALYRRGHNPFGSARQLAAILSAEDRTEALGTVTAPTLVVHGGDDEMIDPSGGDATAAAIPGARLLRLPGMGHDLPKRRIPEIVEAIAANAHR